jgi:hypothetical protein
MTALNVVPWSRGRWWRQSDVFVGDAVILRDDICRRASTPESAHRKATIAGVLMAKRT